MNWYVTIEKSPAIDSVFIFTLRYKDREDIFYYCHVLTLIEGLDKMLNVSIKHALLDLERSMTHMSIGEQNERIDRKKELTEFKEQFINYYK
jgi:predicted ATP-grasp superfamily ATP-dependent carboligase